MTNKIFVFGSNLAGIHGATSAKEAMLRHGARRGVGEGRTGMAYAIPTKDHSLRCRSLEDIEVSVKKFIQYAKDHPELEFNVVAIGCGLAGFRPEQIGPMFKGSPRNVNLPELFTFYNC